jgi:hypothetical protein
VVGYSRLVSADEADGCPAARRCPHVWYWHFSDMPIQPDDVRSPGAKRTSRRKAATSVF